MSNLTANDLKTKGIAAIEAVLADRPEAIVSVRGKERFVVMEIAQYHHLRECELEAALAETHADIAAGRFVKESAAAHVKRVKKYGISTAMTFQLIFTEQYNKRAARFLKRHPELEKQYLKTLQLLEMNPHHPSLRLHPLSGRLQGLHSVSINLSYRITLELLIHDEEIIPINVGDHDVVY